MMQTLLVVDDNTTVQRMIKLAFKEQNVRVNVVQRGRDAFEQIEDAPPDIILTDNAPTVGAFLKSRPKLSHIPVVMLKGAFDASTPGTDETVADGVLTKPLQPQAVVECVRRLLEQRKVAPSKADDNLELEQYFDRLSAAFNRAVSAPFQPDEVLSAAEPPPRPHRDRAARVSPPVTNELIEQITQRVVDRLGERIVRSTATEVVSRLSKWLIVNEVERGKDGR